MSGTPAGSVFLPGGMRTSDGLTERDAATIALWNNAALQELLAELGIARGQLYDAGLLTDPEWIIFFPVGPKQLEFIGYQSVDAIWLRPVRVRAAERNLARVAEQMVQNGLDVVRDVRLAHTDLVLAQRRATLSEEAAAIRSQIAELANRRLEAGDISELEANTTQIDALQAEVLASRAVQDVEIARQRLRTLLGLAVHSDPVVALEDESVELPAASLEQLAGEALAMRPDLRAAQIGVAAACEQVRLAEKRFLRADVGYDANGRGTRGYESGPALRFSLPVFNGNRGQVEVAKAQYEQAERRVITIRDQVLLDVRTAWLQLQQAHENLVTLQTEILPALQRAETLARRNYEGGGTTYFLVLQTTGQYLDARRQELDLTADVRRAMAQLDRSVGHRVARQSVDSVESADALPTVVQSRDDGASLSMSPEPAHETRQDDYTAHRESLSENGDAVTGWRWHRGRSDAEWLSAE